MADAGPSQPPTPPPLAAKVPQAVASAASSAASESASAIRTVLRYTGIPPSLLRVPKFRLPSRNWLIFLSLSGSLLSLYVYDRRECARIRREACDSVRWMAELPLGPQETVRRVRVLAAKQPGDDESAKGMLYFRKWVKPILVAAAVDYEMTVGSSHGSLTRRIAKEIQHKRLVAAGLVPPIVGPTPAESPQAQAEREMQGGIVLVGRATYKEYMEGLKRGWGESVQLGRRGKEMGEDEEDERIARALEGDGVFDEPAVVDPTSTSPEEPTPAPAPAAVARQLQPFRNPFLPTLSELRPNPRYQPSAPSPILPPESPLPSQPPLMLLPYRNLVGLSLLHRQIWGFFNRRQYARSGAEHALILLRGATRPFNPEQDLEWGKETEHWWSSKFDRVDEELAKKRAEYYKDLAKRLATARALSSGERAPTKEEEKNPPKTEQELRQERFEREKRWRREEEGWEIVRRQKGVRWEEGWEGALRVYDEEGKGAI